MGDRSGAVKGGVDLEGSRRVVRNDRYEKELSKGERWESWQLETMLNSLNVLGGFWGWVHVFTLAVSRHFYYLLRK